MTAELTLLYNQGKVIIGYLCQFEGGEVPNFAGLGTNINDYYILRMPAEITYDLEITSNATADVVSHVMPFYPGGFVNGDKNGVYFAFPKTTSCPSTLRDGSFHVNIINQYKQLAGI